LCFYRVLVLAFPMPISVMLITLIMFIFFVFIVLSAIMLIFSMTSIVSAMVGHINIVVPFVFNEIDRPVACIIFAAVFAPFFCMSGGDMQI